MLLEEIDRYAPGYRPPAASRAMGYIGLAGYEAAVHGMPDNQSLANHFDGLNLPAPLNGQVYHWPTAVNEAYYTIFQKFYPHVRTVDLQAIEDLHKSFEINFSGTQDPATFSRSKSYGIAIAEAVYAWSATDAAGHDAYLDPRPSTYAPPSWPGL